EVRGKLEQDRAELAAQRAKPRIHELDRASTCFAKTLPVCDVLRRLPRKYELGGRAVTPLTDGVESGRAIEGAVYLGRDELCRVPWEPILLGDIARIERSAPVIVC